jgi:type I restriction enzyme, S subunit
MSLSRNLSGCQVFHPSDLPTDWDCVPLQARLELLYGRALKEEIREPGGVDVFGSNGKVGSHNVHWLDAPGVLVGRKGTVGAVHYTEKPFWPIDTTYYVKPSGDDEIRYLFYLLDYLPLKILNAATGVPGLSRRDAYALLGAFPPSDEQAAIARVLNAVEAAIDRAREAAAQVREFQRAVVQEFFYSALGVTAYADHPAQKLPVGWTLTPTETLLAEEPKNGVSPQASTQPPGTPTFSIAAVRDGKVDLLNASNLKYAKVSERIADKFRIQTGDVLLVRGNANPDLVGKAGRVGNFPAGCIYPDITKRIVFRREGDVTVLPEYAVLAWNHPIVHNQVLRRAKTSNGTLKINNRDVRQIIMPVPATSEQQSIVELVSAVESKADALRQKLLALEQLKESLTHDLLTGSVRVDPALFQQEATA